MADATLTVKTIDVDKSQLPLSCPTRDSDPAALHPRVYIPLKRPGDRALCPYCGTEYRLVG